MSTIGALQISVVKARKFPAVFSAGYVNLEVGQQKIKSETKFSELEESNLEIKWMEDLKLPVASGDSHLDVFLNFVNLSGEIIATGTSEILLADCPTGNPTVRWYEVKGENDEFLAEICLVLRFLSPPSSKGANLLPRTRVDPSKTSPLSKTLSLTTPVSNPNPPDLDRLISLPVNLEKLIAENEIPPPELLPTPPTEPLPVLIPEPLPILIPKPLPVLIPEPLPVLTRKPLPVAPSEPIPTLTPEPPLSLDNLPPLPPAPLPSIPLPVPPVPLTELPKTPTPDTIITEPTPVPPSVVQPKPVVKPVAESKPKELPVRKEKKEVVKKVNAGQRLLMVGGFVFAVAGMFLTFANREKKPKFYQVKEGDTFCSIAGCYGMKFNDLIDVNLDQVDDPDRIYPGDRIFIPA